jgi:aminopeptidase YwaD
VAAAPQIIPRQYSLLYTHEPRQEAATALIRRRPGRTVLALVCTTLCAVVLSGCGGGDASGTPSAVAGTATNSALPSATAATALPSPTPDALGKPEVDGARVYATVRKLAEDIGPRVAGTPSEIVARDYIQSTLESYGYGVTLQDFGFDASAFLPVRIDLGGAPSIPGIAMRGSIAGVASGTLFDAGTGEPDDFPGAGLNGAIALVQRTDFRFAEKVGNAVAAGASGVIIYNNVAGRLIGDLLAPTSVEVAGITQSAGEDLLARMVAGPVTATITVSPPSGTAYNVIAKPKGVTTCSIIVGGHYDSVAVTGGADDNASGAAAVIEFARVAAASKLPGTNCYVLFGAEEFGLFGSHAFVEKMTPNELQTLRAMINLDVVGVAAPLELIGSDDLTDVARIAAGTLNIEARHAQLPVGTASDHVSFEDAGVPVVMLTRPDNVIHTPQDAMDRIVPESLADTVTLAIATLRAIEGGSNP